MTSPMTLQMALTLYHSNFTRFDFNANFFQPLNGGLDGVGRAADFKADDANLIGHTGLADISDHGKFMAQLPDHGAGDLLGRIHQPQPLLRRIGGGFGFAGWHGNS